MTDKAMMTDGLGHPPVGALTDGEVAMLRAWAEDYAAAQVAAATERLRADRDSWAQQASDRAEDALRIVAAEHERLRLIADEIAAAWPEGKQTAAMIREGVTALASHVSADVAATRAAERERWRKALLRERDSTTVSQYATVRECEAAWNALDRAVNALSCEICDEQ